MKITEKIENARKRINELEELIQYWNRSKKVENIICEVNILPHNKPSINFHKKYGFKEIGQKDTENGKKRVSYMMYKISL